MLGDRELRRVRNRGNIWDPVQLTRAISIRMPDVVREERMLFRTLKVWTERTASCVVM
jgi:hypothetical protein